MLLNQSSYPPKREVVQHPYTDYREEETFKDQEKSPRKGSNERENFPLKLHDALSLYTDIDDMICWVDHGRAFVIKKDWKRLEEEFLCRIFSHSKYRSFTKQLSIYGFKQFTAGIDKGCFYNEVNNILLVHMLLSLTQSNNTLLN
uniref:HSF-type DNA-binding domain-containing protein n=1 Tax=Corethron hystrix TaxID=216773 RepID=A0A7S1BV91_9STRA|mmetsp:Transcript_39952/g.93785  ORF Transcript_39952/g.93785 Transcript_39952/m.93785 type:complete len:145 (+) Transcript_39952:145-579(+)